MSETQADYSRLAEVVAGLGLHEHLCLIYDTQEEQFAVALPFLKAGLERGEKCLYFADENTAVAVLDALRKSGTDVDQHLRRGALTVTHKREIDLQQERFDPDWWVGFLNQVSAEATAGKFSALRILGDMSWALQGSKSTDKLVEYESRINHFVRDHDARVICQYNCGRNSPELILGIIRTHPVVVYGGIVCKNPYYVPPGEFLKPNQPALEVERLLNNILTWELARQALRHSQDHLRLVIDTVPALIHTGRPDGYLDFFNQRWLDYVGLSLEDLLGWKWTALIHPEDVAAMVEGWRAALATGEPHQHESRVRRADGKYRWMVHRDVPLRDERGKIVKWYASSIDIEDRKGAENDVRKQKEILQKIIDNAPIMINFTGADRRIELVNREWERTIGWTLKEIREQNVDIFAEGYPDPQYRQKVLDFVAAAEGKFADFRTRTRDGRVIDTSWARVRLSDGTTIGIGRDITERKRAEESLRRSEDRLRQIIDTIPTMAWSVRPDGTVDFINERSLDYMGLSLQEALEVPTRPMHPEDLPHVMEKWRATMSIGEPSEAEVRLRRADGEYRWFLVRSVPLRDERGNIVKWFGTATEIEDRKRIEEALRASEERWRAIFENSAVGIALTDPKGAITVTNRAFQEMVAYSDEELRRLTYMDITYEEDREANAVLREELWKGKRQQYRHEKRYRRKDGKLIWVRNTVSLTPGAEAVPRFAMAIVEDITEQKRAEEELRRSEAYLAEGQRLSHAGSWALNLSSGEIYWSEETYRIFGYDPAKGPATVNAFLQRLHPEDRPMIERRLSAAATQKEPYEIDYRIVLPGGSIRHIHEVVYPVTNENGEVIERYGLAMDVTERKQTEEELQRSRDQLRALAARLQRVREEERTRVSREIHDELGQALTAIKLDLSSLNRELPADKREQSASLLKLVDETIQSVRRISTELRPAILDALGLVPALEWAAEEFEARTGTKCRLDLPPHGIVIDPERATALFRIFQETLTNVALYANATRMEVRLAVQNGHLSLEMRDDGRGIDEDQLSAATSLGILGMRERALLLGGELTITGAPGKGTTVRVRIPGAARRQPE